MTPADIIDTFTVRSINDSAGLSQDGSPSKGLDTVLFGGASYASLRHRPIGAITSFFAKSTQIVPCIGCKTKIPIEQGALCVNCNPRVTLLLFPCDRRRLQAEQLKSYLPKGQEIYCKIRSGLGKQQKKLAQCISICHQCQSDHVGNGVDKKYLCSNGVCDVFYQRIKLETDIKRISADEVIPLEATLSLDEPGGMAMKNKGGLSW
jgi:hypothetical protein